MIAKPEHLANQQDLFHVAKLHGEELQERIKAIRDVATAIKVSHEIAASYYSDIARIMGHGLFEVGMRAGLHYRDELGLRLTNEEVANLVQELISEQVYTEYYGYTLDQRLSMGRKRLEITLRQASSLNRKPETRASMMARVFYSKGPFQNGITRPKAILLSESVRIEHRIAQHLGNLGNVNFVKWTLSETHNHQDICDTLATNVSGEVEQALKAQKIKINPAGVYFIHNSPNLPHPNCQCQLAFVLPGGGLTGINASRTVEVVRDLIRRLKPSRK